MSVAIALANYQAGKDAETTDANNMVFNLNLTEGTGNPVDKIGSRTMTIIGTAYWTFNN